MAEILIPALALLLPVFLVFVHKYFRYKEKLLELQGRAGALPVRLLSFALALASKVVVAFDLARHIVPKPVMSSPKVAARRARAPGTSGCGPKAIHSTPSG